MYMIFTYINNDQSMTFAVHEPVLETIKGQYSHNAPRVVGLKNSDGEWMHEVFILQLCQRHEHTAFFHSLT